jgi:hypothetical protein
MMRSVVIVKDDFNVLIFFGVRIGGQPTVGILSFRAELFS